MRVILILLLSCATLSGQNISGIQFKSGSDVYNLNANYMNFGKGGVKRSEMRYCPDGADDIFAYSWYFKRFVYRFEADQWGLWFVRSLITDREKCDAVQVDHLKIERTITVVKQTR